MSKRRTNFENILSIFFILKLDVEVPQKLLPANEPVLVITSERTIKGRTSPFAGHCPRLDLKLWGSGFHRRDFDDAFVTSSLCIRKETLAKAGEVKDIEFVVGPLLLALSTGKDEF